MSAPSSVELPNRPGASLAPRVTVYYRGTSAPSSVAVVRFKQVGDTVKVGVALVDGKRVAHAEVEKLQIGDHRARSRSGEAERASEEMFTLKER